MNNSKYKKIINQENHDDSFVEILETDENNQDFKPSASENYGLNHDVRHNVHLQSKK